MRWIAAVVILSLYSSFEVGAVGLAPARLSLLSPRGVRFEIDDVPGTKLTAIHYSVNSALNGVAPGQWNFDIRYKTGNVWVHENKNVVVNPGDTVNYWVYMIINGLGKSLTGQRWTASSNGGSSPNVTPAPAGRPTSSSQTSDKLNGRPLKLVLDETFDSSSVDTSKWTYDVSMWGGGNNEFQTYTPLDQNTYTKDGKLYIKPTLTVDKYGSNFLRSGVWDMNNEFGYCTVSDNYGCRREGKYGLLPPIMSGRIKSKTSIRYGKVEIIAKLPRGDWIWPAFWMLPRDNSYGGWPRSGEIDIMESRGNRNYGQAGVAHMASTLHWGSAWNQNRFSMTSEGTKARTNTLADGYHKYVLLWDATGMELYLDDEKITKFSTPSQGYWRWGNLQGSNPWPTRDAPFDKPFYLLINVAVGGTNGYMPDGVPNEGYEKPWRNSDGNAKDKFWNAKNLWYPTWKGDDAALQVQSVKMWQLE